MTEHGPGMRLGFRARVLGLCALLLLVASAAGLVAQRAVLRNQHDREVDESLEQERQEIERLSTGRDPTTGEPFAGDVAAIFETFLARNVPGPGEMYFTFVDGEPFAATAWPDGSQVDLDDDLLERWAGLEVGERRTAATAAGSMEYLAVPFEVNGRTTGVFVVANFVRERRDTIDDGIRIEAMASAIVLASALGAAWLLAGRLLRPIRNLTVTARSITDSDLTARIPVGGDDEIAELAATFNDMLNRLETAFATQRRFIDDAGHELRTPITIIRGHLEVMGDNQAERIETVALVTDELDRMARIVNDLLLLAQAEQPDFVVLEPVELSDFTTDLLMKCQALGHRAWTLDQAAEADIEADPSRLSQAILNLARNAVEHTRTGDEIGIGSSLRSGQVALWVRDTGPGVPVAEREHVFERFRRGLHGARRDDGTGLGLAIVKAIVDAHHGIVSVGDAPTGGALFTITLPPRSVVGDDLSGRHLHRRGADTAMSGPVRVS